MYNYIDISSYIYIYVTTYIYIYIYTLYIHKVWVCVYIYIYGPYSQHMFISSIAGRWPRTTPRTAAAFEENPAIRMVPKTRICFQPIELRVQRNHIAQKRKILRRNVPQPEIQC